MITHWVTVNRLKISNAERLYPNGIEWNLQPGVNAVIGGTALGKTTLIFALQYGVFDKMINEGGERIEREFFRHRLTKRSEADVKAHPPTVEVEFAIGRSRFLVRRNLLTGSLIEAECDGSQLRATTYEETIAAKVGLNKDFASVGVLQSHLLFFGEDRCLLAWENLLQNELLNLLFSDHDTYVTLTTGWDEIESADSEARNISAQASRLEKDLQEVANTSNITESQRRNELKHIVDTRSSLESDIASLQKALAKEKGLFANQDQAIALAYGEFHKSVDRFEAVDGVDFDERLLAVTNEITPTIASMRRSLELFYQKPNEQTCPCCGRPGVSQAIANFARLASKGADAKRCVVCNKDIDTPALSTKPTAVSTNKAAEKLQKLLFRREQTKSRIESITAEENTILRKLTETRANEVDFLRRHPSSAADPLRITIDQLRERQKTIERRRDAKLSALRRQLTATNSAFARVQKDLVRAFKKYATLYLDEPCGVAFLNEGALPGKRGPQIKAPHAAFLPVISGETRPSRQDLSDAQRSFIDLAFRMAVVEAWHKKTGQTVTMIVETPEGAVDMAYMDRVASMLRTFANHGHTLLISTNLNNDIFLPELLAAIPKQKRAERLLNLLELGCPRKVQKEYEPYFSKVLAAVEEHDVMK